MPRPHTQPPAPPPRNITTAIQMQTSWQWLLSLPVRPQPGPSQVYDDLFAWTDTIGRLMHQDPTVVEAATNLYLISTFADHGHLLRFINGSNAFPVPFPTRTIDPALKRIYRSAPRFRASLAEHLGFWIPIASNRRRRPNSLLAASQPHTLPEDTGPDALLIEARPQRRMELVSVSEQA